MPAMPLRAFSIGMMTADVISSGDAPGSRSETLTWAGSALGKRSTPRSRNENTPSTTSDITSIVANTGRRTQSSDSILVFSLDRDLHAVGQRIDLCHRHAIRRLQPVED